MFTGIIKHTGVVLERKKLAAGRMSLKLTADFSSPVIMGESIAVEGVCLTVSKAGRSPRDCFQVEAVPETLRLTTLGGLRVGRRVNLERSLRMDQRLGGHIVFGHIDGTGRVTAFEKRGDAKTLTVSFPARLKSMLAVKGSVAVNGVSLTVTAVKGNRFSVALIPHTLEITTLAKLKKGDRVNLEADMLARYVASNLKNQSKNQPSSKDGS